MQAFVYNLVAILSVLDYSFLTNVIGLFLIFQFIKNADALSSLSKSFFKSNKVLFVYFLAFLVYVLCSYWRYNFDNRFYKLITPSLIKEIILFSFIIISLSFFANCVNFNVLFCNKQMLFLPIITIPIVLLADVLSGLKLQHFIYITNPGIDNLRIGISYYMLLCLFVAFVFYVKKNKKYTRLTLVIGFISLLILVFLTKIEKIVILAFLISLLSFITFNFFSKIFKKKASICFILIVFGMISGCYLHLKYLNIDISNFVKSKRISTRIQYSQCVWNMTFDYYKKSSNYLFGNGLNSYKVLNIFNDNENYGRLCYKNIYLSLDDIKNGNNEQKEYGTITNQHIFSRKVLSNNTSPGSAVLHILFEFGIVGLCLTFIFILLCLRKIYLLPSNNREQRLIRNAFLTFFCASLFLFSFFYSIYTFWLWIALALITFLLQCFRISISGKDTNG